ncbi:MAG: hypothetical protein IPL53_14740 [Ignavibacteria bacterium]|nr:hypothetical protein [Ignavibacteria bacterium]
MEETIGVFNFLQPALSLKCRCSIENTGYICGGDGIGKVFKTTNDGND